MLCYMARGFSLLPAFDMLLPPSLLSPPFLVSCYVIRCRSLSYEHIILRSHGCKFFLSSNKLILQSFTPTTANYWFILFLQKFRYIFEREQRVLFPSTVPSDQIRWHRLTVIHIKPANPIPPSKYIFVFLT